MSAYLVALLKVTKDDWLADYAARTHDIAARHGGRYLSRSAKVETVEGDDSDLTAIAVIQFPDVASAKAFGSDPDYAPVAEGRRAGSVSRFWVVDDSDALGSIPYLPKG